MENGNTEGKGIMYWNNGDKYEYEWKNDLRVGKEDIFWTVGNKYERDWINDKREGIFKINVLFISAENPFELFFVDFDILFNYKK